VTGEAVTVVTALSLVTEGRDGRDCAKGRECRPRHKWSLDIVNVVRAARAQW
jgi:hypothetical protein